MPRRVRLQFAPNPERKPCAITGLIDDMVVTGFVQRPYGPKYEGWRHPLTPYYQPTAGAAEMLPLHPKVTPIGYRQWTGLLYEGERGAVARSVRLAKDLLPRGRGPVTVLAAGYVTDKMRALDYAESDLPLHILGDKAAQERLETFARTLIAAADAIALELRRAIDKAFAAASGSTLTGAALAGFWARTEMVFRGLLDQAAGHGAGEAGDEARLMLRQSWRRTLEIEALAAFDGAVPLDTLGDLKTAERMAIIQARKALVWTLLGYAKSGAKFFSMLGIAAANKAKETADG
jgi:CRISPR system Cascade subunit CasA